MLLTLLCVTMYKRILVYYLVVVVMVFLIEGARIISRIAVKRLRLLLLMQVVVLEMVWRGFLEDTHGRR